MKTVQGRGRYATAGAGAASAPCGMMRSVPEALKLLGACSGRGAIKI